MGFTGLDSVGLEGGPTVILKRMSDLYNVINRCYLNKLN